MGSYISILCFSGVSHDFYSCFFLLYLLIHLCIFNLLDRYNSQTGTFTANVKGLFYDFSVYIEVDHDAALVGYIANNKIGQCWARGQGREEDDSYEYDDDTEEASTCSAVVHLNVNVRVNVVVEDVTGGSSPFETVKHNGFTGFLIQAA